MFLYGFMHRDFIHPRRLLNWDASSLEADAPAPLSTAPSYYCSSSQRAAQSDVLLTSAGHDQSTGGDPASDRVQSIKGTLDD